MSRFAKLQQALTDPQPVREIGIDRTPRGERSAAVLALFTDEDDPLLTFITRSATLRSHAGQIALPGGAVDDTDRDRAHTALREANEEIGLDPDQVTVLGQLPALWVPASRYDVTTIVGSWPGDGELSVMDPREVDAVHQYRVSELTSAETRLMGRHPSGFRGPSFVLGDQFIWGLTGHLVDWVLDLAGWSQEWDRARIADIPERFMRD
ncbi:MAG: CoA pyrophosphatase [Propionibacteriaceae bacterium]|nr:CoA pyrophosphatase [Propionibacteriaceae bacterium]